MMYTNWDIPKLIKELTEQNVPNRDTLVKDIKSKLIAELVSNRKRLQEAVTKGEISTNGTLDYPPEILILLFEKSKWSYNIRKLNIYLLNVYNSYVDLRLHMRKDKDMKLYEEKYRSIFPRVKIVKPCPPPHNPGEIHVEPLPNNPDLFKVIGLNFVVRADPNGYIISMYHLENGVQRPLTEEEKNKARDMGMLIVD